MFGTLDFPVFEHGGEVDDFVIGPLSARFPHERPCGDELRKVLVRSHHERLKPRRLSPFYQGADHVIGFEAIDLEHRDVKRAAERLDVRDGCGEFLGHFVAVRLVRWKLDMPRGGSRGVKRNPDVARLFIFQNGQQRGDEAIQSGGIDALGIADRGLDEAKVGPIDQGHAIKEKQAHWDGWNEGMTAARWQGVAALVRHPYPSSAMRDRTPRWYTHPGPDQPPSQGLPRQARQIRA